MIAENEIDRRLTRIEDGLSRTENALAKLAEAMVTVARLEVALTHNGEAVNRAFRAIEKLAEHLERHEIECDNRLKRLEESQPVQRLVSGWVLAWIAGVVGLVGGAVAMRVLTG